MDEKRARNLFFDAVREAFGLLSAYYSFFFEVGINDKNNEELFINKIKKSVVTDNAFWQIVAHIISLKCEAEGVSEEEKNKLLTGFINEKYLVNIIEIIKINDDFAKLQMETLSMELKLSKVKEMEEEVKETKEEMRKESEVAEQVMNLFKEGKLTEDEAIKKVAILKDKVKAELEKVEERLSFMKRLKDSAL
jgi:methyl-accepting chemotaxis protein